VPLLDLFWTMLWFFLFFLWIWILISLFADIFRSDDLSGWAKAGWVFFLIFLPMLGALVYLIARGKSMQERAIADHAAREKAQRAYIRSAAGSGSSADELAKLADLRDKGVLTSEEFETQKAAILG